MLRDDVLALIEKDQLEEALQLLKKQASNKSAVATLLARLNSANREKDMGTLTMEQYNLEINRIRAGIINLVEEKKEIPPALEKSNRIRVVFLGAIVLVGALVGLITLFQQDKDMSPEFIANLKQEIGNEYYEFTRNSIPINTVQPYKVGLAYLKREFNWTADIAFFADTKTAQLSYNPDADLLNVAISKIQLLEKFHIKNQKSKTLENSLWVEENSMDGEFWKEINSTTAALLEVKLNSEPALKKSFYDIAKKELQLQLKRLLVAEGFQFTEVNVNINAIETVSGKLIR